MMRKSWIGAGLLAIGVVATTGSQTPKPTYSSHTASFIQKNCVSCHRAGGIAPFSLETYDQVKKFGPAIKNVVQNGTMPPWFAKNEPGKPSPWANDRSIPESEKAKLSAWVQGGMPEGVKSKAPKSKPFDPKWQIGKPDAVYQLTTPTELPADGVINYKYFDVPMDSAQDRYVEAVEVRPGDRSVVHHVLVFLVSDKPTGRGRGLGGLIDYFAIYVPGNGAVVYPKGFARFVPKDHHLKFQIHYTTSGKATKDQTAIAFRYAREKPLNLVKTASLVNFMFAIPPGAPNHAVLAKQTMPADMTIVSFLPHMHVRGKAARYEMTTPEGEKKMILDVPKYDFNWQLQYDLKEPLVIKKGTKLEYTAWFDNSDKNAANPDPQAPVRWGEQTFEEMALGYVVYVVPNK